jgi:hypothetical protein
MRVMHVKPRVFRRQFEMEQERFDVYLPYISLLKIFIFLLARSFDAKHIQVAQEFTMRLEGCFKWSKIDFVSH